jgi:hypothetical protein
MTMRQARLLIPERLYGRECEIDTLLASFDRTVTNELHKVLVLPRGRFASGCHGTASTLRVEDRSAR